MKRINVKKLVVATLALAAIGATASGFALVSPMVAPIAYAAPSEAPTPATFEMIQGASVRTVAESGIRFSTYVNKSWLAGEMAKGEVEIGTLVIPKSKLASTSDVDFSLTTENVQKYVHSAEKWLNEGEYYKMNAVLSGIPDAELATGIAAKSYVIVGDSVTYVTNPQVRSIAAVASHAVADGNESEYLDEVLDKTIADISISYEGAQEGVEGFRLAEGEAKTLSVSATFVDGLKETPTDLADYAIAWESADETSLTVENGVVTSLGGEATVTAKLAGGVKTASTPVRASVWKDTAFFDESLAFVLKQNGSLFCNAWPSGVAVPEVYTEDATYIKEGDSSWKWEIATHEKGYAGLEVTGVTGYACNLYNIFADDSVESFSFDVYNAHTADIDYCIGHYIYGVNYNAARDRVNGTLKAKEWTTVTITKEAFAHIKSDVAAATPDIMFACNDNPTATLYLDNFKINGPVERIDGGLEGKFYISGGTMSAIFSNAYQGASAPTVNTDAAYVKEGDSSWKYEMSVASKNYAGLALACGDINDSVLSKIFSNSTIQNFSFDVYNTHSEDINYCMGYLAYGSNGGKERVAGSFKAGEWTTVTITREAWELIVSDLGEKLTDDIVFACNGNPAATLYIDNFVVASSADI